MSYKIGDFVKVVNPGKTYTTYSEKFVELGFNNIARNESFRTGTVGQIFGITEHDSKNKTMLALVDKDGNECLIDAGGVEPLTYERKKSKLVRVSSEYQATITSDKMVVGCQTISKKALLEVIKAAKEVGFIE